MTKFTEAEITESITNFVAVTAAREGIGYAAGYFGHALMNAMLDMPRHKQAEILETMNRVMIRVMSEGIES